MKKVIHCVLRRADAGQELEIEGFLDADQDGPFRDVGERGWSAIRVSCILETKGTLLPRVRAPKRHGKLQERVSAQTEAGICGVQGKQGRTLDASLSRLQGASPKACRDPDHLRTSPHTGRYDLSRVTDRSTPSSWEQRDKTERTTFSVD